MRLKISVTALTRVVLPVPGPPVMIDIWSVRALRMASRHFKVAPCFEKLDGSRGRPCLYYHMNQCLGPCTAGLTTREDYRRAVDDLRLFLEGRSHDLLARLAQRPGDVGADVSGASGDEYFHDAATAPKAITRLL